MADDAGTYSPQVVAELRQENANRRQKNRDQGEEIEKLKRQIADIGAADQKQKTEKMDSERSGLKSKVDELTATIEKLTAESDNGKQAIDSLAKIEAERRKKLLGLIPEDKREKFNDFSTKNLEIMTEEFAQSSPQSSQGAGGKVGGKGDKAALGTLNGLQAAEANDFFKSNPKDFLNAFKADVEKDPNSRRR